MSAPAHAHRVEVAHLTADARRSLRRALEERGVIAPHPPRRLVAFWTPAPGEPPSPSELRAFLADRLPEYMCPHTYGQREAMPRLPGGKVDRRQLALTPPDDDGSATTFCPPRTETETTLAHIWQEALGLDRVSVHDDFFEVGGDSLLSIRVLARARREGLALSSETFFESPTIAALASTLDATGPMDAPTPRPTLDEPATAPLTPIQHWFFEHIPRHQDHWNQATWLEAPDDLDESTLQTVVRALLDRHDALRLTFETTPDGGRRQVVHPVPDPLPIRRVELAEDGPATTANTMETVLRETHASLDLATGPLVRFVWFDAPASAPRRLLVVAHHLLVDAVSWSVLREDIQQLYRAIRQRDTPPPSRPTVSWGEWSARLQRRAPEFSDEVTYWLAPSGAQDPEAPPVDHPYDPTLNIAGPARRHRTEVDAAFTRGLGRAAGRRTRVADLLVAALGLAWTEWSGHSRVFLDLEHHGRDVLADELDVSRTVGWFTTVFPVWLTTSDGPPRTAEDYRQVTRRVAEQIRTVESTGAAHGIVRYLRSTDAAASTLRHLPHPWLLFNYLGRHDPGESTGVPFREVTGPAGDARHPDGPRAYLLEINAGVSGDALFIDLEYQPAFHDETRITDLADRLQHHLARIVDVLTPPTTPSRD